MTGENVPNGDRQRQSSAHGHDARVQRSRDRVMGVTLELLTENGLGGVSVDEISRRSGVAKTTIYRHWPTRSDLILDACAQLGTQQDVPETGNLEGDLTALLTHLAGLLQTARWATVMPSMIDAAERDADLAVILSRIQQGHAAPFRAIITRAIVNGELLPGTEPDAMIAALLGPLYYRRWFSREPLDGDLVNGVIKGVVGCSRSAAAGPVDGAGER